jgi:hypothetical protein
VGQRNELYCKLIAYNITVLIHEMFELGIKADFGLKEKSLSGATFPPTLSLPKPLYTSITAYLEAGIDWL